MGVQIPGQGGSRDQGGECQEKTVFGVVRHHQRQDDAACDPAQGAHGPVPVLRSAAADAEKETCRANKATGQPRLFSEARMEWATE